MIRFFTFFVLNIFGYLTLISAEKKMELTVTKRLPLNGILSASGIEILGKSIYLIGDNSPWLYKLNSQYEIEDKLQIFSFENVQDEIIPKALKPDFEAMTAVQGCKPHDLYVFGSGSKSPLRDILVKIDVNGKNNFSHYSLVSFYSQLKNKCNLTDDEMNIEAAIANKDFIYLFNRGKNMIIQFSLSQFNSFIEEENTEISFKSFAIKLPEINGLQAGFSGATFWKEERKIIFTASVENTPNWIVDGEVLGSFVGILDLNNLQNNDQSICLPITENGKNIPLKIESIAIKSVQQNKVELIMVTDSDGGESEIIEAWLLF